MILFKSDKEKFDEEISKAISDRNKGNLEGAVNHYLKAYEIASKTSDSSISSRRDEVLCYAHFFDAVLKKTPDSFSKASSICSKLDPSIELDIGIAVKPKPQDLAKDLEIVSILMSIPRFNIYEAEKYDLSISKLYEDVGNKLLSEGSRRLIIEDIIGIHEPLSVIGLRLLGYAKIIVAVKNASDDPLKSVELFSEALSYLQQAAPEVRNYVSEKLDKLSKATKCWICHREIQGEEFNFIYLPASLNKYVMDKYGNETQFIFSNGRVAVCRVCYTMVYNLSEALAKKYYDMAVQLIREVEMKLMMRIDQLNTKISILESRIRNIPVRI